MNMSRLLVSVVFSVLMLIPAAAADKLQMGVSVDVVPVASDFSGRDIVVFGAIESDDQPALYRGEYSVVVEVVGALEEAVVRRKERIAGIWINADARKYADVPSFYSVLSENELADISDPSVMNSLAIGVDNLKAKPVDRDKASAFLTESEFSSALRRIRIDQQLFSEDPEALKRLSPSLFRAVVKLPPNVPIGVHEVRGHLFRNGKKLDEVNVSFEIRKVGFERWIYNLAHEQSLLYGIMCVLLAIFTGWFANVVFRKN